VRGFTRALAAALGPFNITVNSYCPGTVITQMQLKNAEEYSSMMGITVEEYFKVRFKEIPMGRAQTPEEIAAFVSYLASDDAKNITGQNIMLNGGHVMC
jgi:NAD(P)-dependent dehydrogenase (short-subunit alcohol dehydrogenase family)